MDTAFPGAAIEKILQHCGFSGLKGGAMNRIENKEMAAEAARYFKEEILEVTPDVPRRDLCNMVDEYIYYQQDDVSRDEAHAVVEETCIKN